MTRCKWKQRHRHSQTQTCPRFLSVLNASVCIELLPPKFAFLCVYLHGPGGAKRHRSLCSGHICVAHIYRMWGLLHIYKSDAREILESSARQCKIQHDDTNTPHLFKTSLSVGVRNCVSVTALKQGTSEMDVEGFTGQMYCTAEVTCCPCSEMPSSLSPTGVSGPQSSAQRRGRAVRGAAADIIWPHFGRERNFQWGGGGNAQHPLWVSPGRTNTGFKFTVSKASKVSQ